MNRKTPVVLNSWKLNVTQHVKESIGSGKKKLWCSLRCAVCWLDQVGKGVWCGKPAGFHAECYSDKRQVLWVQMACIGESMHMSSDCCCIISCSIIEPPEVLETLTDYRGFHPTFTKLLNQSDPFLHILSQIAVSQHLSHIMAKKSNQYVLLGQYMQQQLWDESVFSILKV